MMGLVADKLQRIEFSIDRYNNYDTSGKPTWSRINQDLYDATSRLAAAPLPGSAGLISKARKITNLSERIEFILKEIHDNFQWKGDYDFEWDGANTFFHNDIVRAWVEKSGNNVELNLALLNLLNRSGVDCSPLMVSTRKNGAVDKSFVRAAQFDGLVIMVSDTSRRFFLDATIKHLSHEVVPPNIINTEAFLLNDKAEQWIKITDNRPLIKQTFIATASINDEGLISGTASVDHYHYSKLAKLWPDDEDENLLQSDRPELLSYNQNFTFEDVKLDSTKGNRFPLTENFKFKLNLTGSENLYVLTPVFLENLKTNPFISDKRTFDIDFVANQEFIVSLNLTLTDNFSVDELPKNNTLVKNDSTVMFTRRSSLNGKTLQYEFKLEYLKSYFAKEEYSSLKEFFRKMYAVLNEPIVLRKKQ